MGGVMSLKKGDGEFEFFSFSLKEKESEILYFGYFYISSRGRRIIVGMCVWEFGDKMFVCCSYQRGE